MMLLILLQFYISNSLYLDNNLSPIYKFNVIKTGANVIETVLIPLFGSNDIAFKILEDFDEDFDEDDDEDFSPIIVCENTSIIETKKSTEFMFLLETKIKVPNYVFILNFQITKDQVLLLYNSNDEDFIPNNNSNINLEQNISHKHKLCIASHIRKAYYILRYLMFLDLSDETEIIFNNYLVNLINGVIKRERNYHNDDTKIINLNRPNYLIDQMIIGSNLTSILSFRILNVPSS